MASISILQASRSRHESWLCVRAISADGEVEINSGTNCYLNETTSPAEIIPVGFMKAIHIRLMKNKDRAFGLRLSRQARWNQTEADWLRLLYLESEGCFVAELDGAAVGTTTTCVLGQVAWIAMVLVDENHRRRGIGTHLLRHALEYLDNRQAPTIRLDATQLGRPVYEKLGFAPEYELARYQGTARPCQALLAMAEASAETYPDIIEFDQVRTGTNREKMLTRLFHEFPQNLRALRRKGNIVGYLTMRPGAETLHIGPCSASPNAGPALLRDALCRCAEQRVCVDIPLKNAEAVNIAESNGLTIQRRFTRMCRGERVDDNVAAMWASSGPEKG
jgi:GNAT superfamily N-acetyltransferase